MNPAVMLFALSPMQILNAVILKLNTLRPIQNCCNFADGIFKYIFLNINVWISLKFSLKFVPKVRINNILAMVQIMAWRWPGDKPLSEPMMFSLLTHICVTRPQWLNPWSSGNKWRHTQHCGCSCPGAKTSVSTVLIKISTELDCFHTKTLYW